jgi:GNAT superfamily N-acetyltransferase
VTRVRQISAAERLTTTFPLQAYGFEASPAAPDVAESFRDQLPYVEGNTTLVVEDGDTTLAAASSIPMRQHVRGRVLDMAGIGGVVSHPLARRQGHIRTLLDRLLGQVRDAGAAISALYPFRPSFYARFGYVGLPQARRATFPPDGLAPLLRAELPGEVRWRAVAEGYDDLRALTLRLLDRVHGFAVFPDFRAVSLRDQGRTWLATAEAGGEVIGVLTYTIEEHGGALRADALLTTEPLGRALLLQFLARHVDQVATVSLIVTPDENPELWATDLAVRTVSSVAFPGSPAPMARVLSVPGLAGIAVGAGAVTVEVVDDPYVGGVHALAAGPDGLEVGSGGRPAATLTAAGLSALVYGVLDPAELPLRGLGAVPGDAAAALRRLFPPRTPFVYAVF